MLRREPGGLSEIDIQEFKASIREYTWPLL
jgi:hypothetical protein